MKVEKIENHIPQDTHTYIFDSNVWIKLMAVSFQEDANSLEAKKYAKLLEDIFTAGSKIGILSIELSEIFNVFFKKRYTHHLNFSYKKIKASSRPKYSNFKAINNYKKFYRNTEKFENDLKYITNEINSTILKNCIKLSDEFDLIEDNHILGDKVTNFDFNDNFMCRYCEKKGYVFVTHDSDYISYSNLNFQVLTALI